MGELTHLDKSGHARMVDVGDKAHTQREAVADEPRQGRHLLERLHGRRKRRAVRRAVRAV